MPVVPLVNYSHLVRVLDAALPGLQTVCAMARL